MAACRLQKTGFQQLTMHPVTASAGEGELFDPKFGSATGALVGSPSPRKVAGCAVGSHEQSHALKAHAAGRKAVTRSVCTVLVLHCF